MVAALDSQVMVVADVSFAALDSLLRQYGLELVLGKDDEPVTGSFWGGPEAGIVGDKVHVRSDTPIHSLLHETCHVICMTRERRANLDRNAGGDDLEEAATCYLQIVLADYVDGVGGNRLMQDMDSWGYSFRLGSTRRWFEQDAEDARDFLINQGVLMANGSPTFVLRT